MPKDKDRKRLVRSRMQKTGESYTTARAHVLRQPRHNAPSTPTADDAAAAAREAATADATGAADASAPDVAPALPADAEALAGHRNEVLVARTGRTWAEWTAALDAAGAAAMTHTAIAALLQERFAVPGWWAQAVTVGYERLRGRRARNQVASGFAVSKSKTFAHPLAAIVRAFAPRARAAWLGDAPVRPRRSSKRTVVRWVDADGTWVDAAFEAKAPRKTVVTVQHSRLAARADVERCRASWAQRLAALGEWLDAH